MRYYTVAKRTTGFIILLTALTACSKLSPAGFWLNYQKKLIIFKTSDQGPRGGHREINWEATNAKTFDVKQVIDFAKENGWQLVDSFEIEKDTLSLQPKPKADDYAIELFKQLNFRKTNPIKSTIFMFKTGWIAIEPGNARETYQNGFLIFSDDFTKMKVYHSWGE